MVSRGGGVARPARSRGRMGPRGGRCRLQRSSGHTSHDLSTRREIVLGSLGRNEARRRSRNTSRGRRAEAVRSSGSAAVSVGVLPAFLPDEAKDVEEKEARDAIMRIEQRQLSGERKMVASFIGPGTRGTRDEKEANSGGGAAQSKLSLVLLHGFDSSCLERRRLMTQLDTQGLDEVDVYALDIFGWGFSGTSSDGSLDGIETDDDGDYGPDAKRAYLSKFIAQVVRGGGGHGADTGGADESEETSGTKVQHRVIVVGASLGGAVALDLAVNEPDTVDGLVLINAQGYIEGVGNMAKMPTIVAREGLRLLRSWPLRWYANKIAYYDPKTFATADALRVGRLHCVRPEWMRASLSFMNSGGYSTASRIPDVACPALIVWGREDRILSPSYAEKFLKDLRQSELAWIEQAGHVPHLEQPTHVADAILSFCRSLSE